MTMNAKYKVFSILGMIIGITSITTCYLSVIFKWITLIIALVGLILSGLSLKSENNRKMTIAGTVLNLIGVILGILLVIFIDGIKENMHYNPEVTSTATAFIGSFIRK